MRQKDWNLNGELDSPLCGRNKIEIRRHTGMWFLVFQSKWQKITINLCVYVFWYCRKRQHALWIEREHRALLEIAAKKEREAEEQKRREEEAVRMFECSYITSNKDNAFMVYVFTCKTYMKLQFGDE